MFEMIKSIIDILFTFVNFIISTLTSIISLITYIPIYLQFVFDSINVLPSFLIPFALAFITLIVVQYITNRKA